MSEANKALVRRMFEETDGLEGKMPAGLFAADFTAHIPGSPPMNLDTFQQFLEMWYAAFSDWNHTIEHLLAEGDRAAVCITAEAIHTAEFMGIPASGKRISVVSIGIARIAGGRVAEWWNAPDQLGLMQQLGVVPPPQATR